MTNKVDEEVDLKDLEVELNNMSTDELRKIRGNIRMINRKELLKLPDLVFDLDADEQEVIDMFTNIIIRRHSAIIINKILGERARKEKIKNNGRIIKTIL